MAEIAVIDQIAEVIENAETAVIAEIVETARLPERRDCRNHRACR